MKKSNLLLAIPLAILWACSTPTPKVEGIQSAMSDDKLVADTIFYPVRIKNIDPKDEWADIRLKKLDRKKLVDDLFESVYSGKAVAYNYLTDSPIAMADIEEMEKQPQYARDNVIELEFREKWWFDAQTSTFKKEVLSVLVAYALFEDDGSLRGLKAAFYIKTHQ